MAVPAGFEGSVAVAGAAGSPSLASWYSLSVLSLSETFSAVLESSEEVDSYLGWGNRV